MFNRTSVYNFYLIECFLNSICGKHVNITQYFKKLHIYMQFCPNSFAVLQITSRGSPLHPIPVPLLMAVSDCTVGDLLGHKKLA